MKRRGQKSKSGSFSTAFLAALLLFCVVYLAITDIRLQKRKNALEYQFNDILKKKQESESVNTDLKAKVSEIGNKDYQEEVLREKGMYKKAGEGVIVVKDLQGQLDDSKKNIQGDDDSLITQISRFFKRIFSGTKKQ
ncbi:hypothetical protein KBC01_00595 [Candidatus Parcubacteria bacterium]|nr:hypothetical protein [Candidatus Parcubacteria bacterium]